MPKFKSKLLIFRSMKFKIVSVFVLTAIAIILVIGTFLFTQVSDFYYENFKSEMERAFSGEMTSQLKQDLTSEKPPDKINETLKEFSGELGIDVNRSFYILDSSGNCILESNLNHANLENPKITPNLAASMNGEIGSSIQKGLPCMDYSYPLFDQGEIRYIIYIADNKFELVSSLKNIFGIILQSLGLGILLSVLFGFVLSNKITAPIANVTKKAQKIAAGDFEYKIEVKSKDEIGKLTNSFNFMANELKNTLTEIANEKNKMETILHNMADGVIAFDSDGNIIHINPAAVEMFHIKQTRHSNFDEIFSPMDDGITLYDLLYLKPDKTVERQFNLDSRYIKALFAPLTTERQKAAGVIVVLQDVTNSQRLDKSRREFVANVSHELRTPLTTVKTYIETIIDSGLSDPNMTMRFLKVIDSETNRMTRLIKDLLMLSRLDYSDEISRSRLSIDRLAQDVISKFSIEAKNAGIDISYKMLEKLPAYYGDRDRLEQVFSNILSNAIKYTPFGGKIDVLTYSKDSVTYVLVKDTGIGIPKKDLPRIFERFYRVDKARSRENGGTGLGLAIAKEIVEKFNGSIHIESEVGSGTEVTIALPLLF